MSVTNQAVPDQPRTLFKRSIWHLHPGVRSGDQLTVGERAADHMRNGMGSWTFVFLFLCVMAIWMMVNSLLKLGHPVSSGSKGFDPYPYILLNLVLSTLAGLQAAALLIAAKRADAVSSEIAVHTLHNTEADSKLLQENTELTRQVKSNTDLLAELHRHVTAIGDHLGISPGTFPATPPQAQTPPGPDTP